MSLQLYNTLTRQIETFVPLRPGEVRMYVCGLTPSAEAHLGHARSFLFFDVLRRYLEHPRNEYRVTYVQNVTDIDDRAIAAAQAEHADVMDVVGRYYAVFKRAMHLLGVREPDIEPHATQHIDAIVSMIAELMATGHAYASDDGVYYAVKSFPRYGELSHRNVDELLVGARIAENESKRDPLDFALWKFAKPGEPFWPAPWGVGRPGWHIECSAMARELLGVTLDIHGGGFDLVFPHHENEIAQSEALMPPDQRLARYWLHGGLLNFDGRKMSKSLGNFEPLSAILERHDPLAIRLLFLQTGYRKPMNFTEDAIAGATAGLERLRKAYDALGGVTGTVPLDGEETVDDIEYMAERFFAALDEDMNTAGALGTLFDAAAAAQRIATENDPDAAAALRRFFEDALGVLGMGPALERVPVGVAAPAVDAATVARIERTIDERNAARKARDFAHADSLRDALAAEGIVLKDNKDGTTWTVGGA